MEGKIKLQRMCILIAVAFLQTDAVSKWGLVDFMMRTKELEKELQETDSAKPNNFLSSG